MKRPLPSIFLTLAVLMAVAACSGSGSTPASNTSGQGLGLTVPPANVSEPLADDSTLNGNSVGGEDEIAPSAAAPAIEAVPEGESIGENPVRGPDGSLWQKEGATKTQHQSDIEDCFNYAWAQTRNDVRISDDRAAARSDRAASFSGLTDTRRNFDLQDQKRRVGTLMEDCMTGRGYLRI